MEELENLHGRTRTTCQLCGECDVGCNYGAKNTLDYNYLTHAAHHGAELRTLCDVRSFEPRDGGGYAVTYAALEDVTPAEDDGRPPPLRTVTCDHLVLSAGTLGTTNLLLRNRAAFPRLSRRLGTHFCGNGDLLTLAINTREMVDGKPTPRIVDPGYGPVITSTARMPDALDGGEGRGFYLQDAGYPQQLAWILHVLAAPKSLWAWRSTAMFLVKNWLQGSPDTDVSGYIADLLQSRELSAGGLPLLGMGRDIPDGRMFLRNGRLDLDWNRKRSAEYFARLRTTSRGFAHALGGRFADNPIWFLRRVITVHPLGGCPMGRDATEGVVDPYGNVFGYPGLHIADGSVMPGPVGPNPSFTIAALADRFADQHARTRPPRRGGSSRMTSTVRFTEEMLGHVTFGESDFDRGAEPTRDGAGALMFHLTIEVPDIEPLRHRPAARRRAPSATCAATRWAASSPSSAASSTSSSTPSPASSACSTGSGSATAWATR